MNRLCRYLLAVFAANLLFGAVAWFVTWYVPDRLQVFVRAPHGVTLKVGYREADGSVDVRRLVVCHGSGEVQSAESFFNVPLDAARLVLSFERETRPCTCERVEVLRHGCLCSVLEGPALESAFDRQGDTWTIRPAASGLWRLKFRPGTVLLWTAVGGELLIWLLALFAVRVRPVGSVRRNLVQSALVALLAAFLLAVAIPLQSYWANAPMFAFTGGEFAAEASVVFGLVFALVFVALLVSGPACGSLLHWVVLSLAVYEYLETGILAARQPPLNGEIWYFWSPARQRIDLAIWSALVIVPLASYRWLRAYAPHVALGALVMVGASLFDVRHDDVMHETPGQLVPYAPKMDVVKSAAYSPKRNVLVFVVDSVPQEAAMDAIDENPALRKKFDGFVGFANNVGMGPATKVGLPGLMLGEYQGKEEPLADYDYAVFTDRSFIAPFVKRGADVSFIPDYWDNGFGISTRLGARACETVRETAGTPFSRCTSDALRLSLRDIVRFRMLPFKFKCGFLMSFFEGVDAALTIDCEEILYPLVMAQPVDEKVDLALQVYHTYGCHLSLRVDKHGDKFPSGKEQTYAGVVSQAHFILGWLGRVFDDLRQRGLYDRTAIVVCADHGNSFCKVENEPLLAKAYPLFWYKPEGASAPFAAFGAATSHCKLANLVRALADGPVDAQRALETVRQDERLFRDENDGEWLIDAKGNYRFRGSRF